MSYRYFFGVPPHEAAYDFTPDVARLMEVKIWEPILILDDKTQFLESRKIFGYYAGHAPNKGALNCSWFWTKDHGLIACSFQLYNNSLKYHNRFKVPVSGGIKEQSSKCEPVKFISADEAKDRTDDRLPAII